MFRNPPTARSAQVAPTLWATRDFSDAGTGRSFTADQPIEADAGEIGNYLACGLVTDIDPASTAAGAARA